jgi:hypothetical protein
MTIVRTSAIAAAIALCAMLSTVTPAAQGSADARLVVTVVDQTGGVLPGATVTLTRSDDPAGAIAPVTTSAQGAAAVAGLRPGRYTIVVAFTGFASGIVRDVRLRAGENKQTVALALEKLADTVTVGRDRQEAAADRQGAFGSALTREQLDALSDDPDILRQQLADLAGPGAVIRVDSFEGAPLPPKAQIKSIHITRDGFAAENHNAGAFFIDIVTQPGIGPVRGSSYYQLRDGVFTGRSPFTPVKGPEQLHNYGVGVGGTLVPQKSSFSAYLQGTSSYDTPNLNAALPSGTRAEALGIRRPRDTVNGYGLLDYALTRDQTLRMLFNQAGSSSSNLGVGAYDLPERAYATRDSTRNLRVQETGPIGRRLFLNSRINVVWSHSDQYAALEAPTFRVLDAFTSGGAQMNGGRDSTTVNLASDLDYVRGRHSLRAGLQVDGGSWRSTLNSNYLGTYTFDSLAAYEAGRPSNYTLRVGDPTIAYGMLNAGVYVQDDIRVRKSLTLSPGVRYELQTHLHDSTNFGPRIGATWAPFPGGRTTIRASAGVFYDWLGQNTYEQALRVDGSRQQELNIADPDYPNPGLAATTLLANRYVLDPGLQNPRNTRVSAGLEQMLVSRPAWIARMNVLYAYTKSDRDWRGLNLNAPVDGIRPNAAFANVVETVDDASARQHQLTIGWNIGLPPQPPGNDGPKLFDWKRSAVYGSYVVTRARNNTDGDFSIAPTGSLVDQWGRSPADLPSRLNLSLTTLSLRRLSATFVLNGISGVPFTETTGVDDNGDGVFNDRPPLIARNTLRGAMQWNLSGYFSYAIPIQKRKTAVPGGIMVTNLNGKVDVNTFTEAARYRLTIVVNAQNLTNAPNYVGYSGVLTSPFFAQPTAVVNPRRITAGLQFNF